MMHAIASRLCFYDFILLIVAAASSGMSHSRDTDLTGAHAISFVFSAK